MALPWRLGFQHVSDGPKFLPPEENRMCPGLSVGVHGKTDQKAFWKEGSQSRVFGQFAWSFDPNSEDL